MSWAGLASNQIVSNNNLIDAVSTGVFAAKVNIPASTRELTRAAVESYVYVNPITSKATNQLVAQSDLSPSVVGPGPYNYYVYAVDYDSLLKSTNGGFTFSRFTALPFGGTYTALAASYSGQYLVVGSYISANQVYVSSDYGVSFTSVSIPTGTGVFNTTLYPCDIAMSSDGQNIAVVVKTVSAGGAGYITVATSNNFGNTFTTYTSNYFNGTGSYVTVSVSANGQYMTYVAIDFTNNRSWRYLSSNYGTTFPTSGLSTNQLFYNISISATGQYQFIVNKGTSSTGNFFVSNNYGASFASRSNQGGTVFCGMDDSGRNMVAVSNTVGTGNVAYSSTDFGVNWSTIGTNIPNVLGIAAGTDLVVPTISSYLAAFQTNYCNYWPISGSSTFYSQPLSVSYTLHKVYRKAIKYSGTSTTTTTIAPIAYVYYITDPQPDPSVYGCLGVEGYPYTVYSSSPSFQFSYQFFTDSGLTTPYTPYVGDGWYQDSTFENATLVQIDFGGYNVATYGC